MTTTKTPIGLDDIAAIITAEEGRAVALALFNQLPRWIEITNDPATLPPIDKWVVVRFRTNEYPASLQKEGNYMACMENSFVTILDGISATRWRPI